MIRVVAVAVAAVAAVVTVVTVVVTVAVAVAVAVVTQKKLNLLAGINYAGYERDYPWQRLKIQAV